MATFRNRIGKWQARVQTKSHAALSKTFINKVDAERWAKQVEVEIEIQKGIYTNLILAERTTLAEIIERYIVEVLPKMRDSTAEHSAKSVMFRYLTDLEKFSLAILKKFFN